MTIEEIHREFPWMHTDEARVYMDARKLYDEASDNIEKNGAVTGHPKTGAPMINPYLSIRESCIRTILQVRRGQKNAIREELSVPEVGFSDASLAELLASPLIIGTGTELKRV